CAGRAPAPAAYSAHHLPLQAWKQVLFVRSFAGAGGGLAVIVPRQLVECGAEILRLSEVTVDRSKSHIGDVIELAQMLHHDLANRLGGYFGFTLTFQFTNDFGSHLLDAFGFNRALAQ